MFPIVQPGERLIDLQQPAALRAEGFGARENTEQQNLGIRLAGADLVHDGGDAFQDVGIGVAVRAILVFAGVVGADHDDRDLGLDAVKLSLLKAPEDVFGAVAAHAKVDDLARAVKFRPDILAATFPTLGDGIADEFNVVFAGRFLGALQHERLAVGAGAGARHGHDRHVGVNHRHGGNGIGSRCVRLCGQAKL